MLLKMLPDQVADQWETIWPAIEIALPTSDSVGSAKTSILKSMMSGEMDCWIMKSESNDDIYALATTCLFHNPSGSRSLFIYSLYGFRQIPFEMWTASFETLIRWASSKGCSEVLAYTSNEKLISLARRLGGNTSNVLVTLPVSHNGKLVEV